MEIIARREVILKDRETGESLNAVFEMQKPYPVDNEKNYFCPVRISGIDDEWREVGGLDSLQALSLGTKWLEMQFKEMRKEKYDFFWPEDAPMDSFDYFPPGIL